MLTLTFNKVVRRLGIIFTLIVIIILTLCNKSNALVSQTTEFYVADYAGLLNNDVKDYIINTNKSLNTQTGAQIVVVTVENLEDESIEQYATDLFRKFGIGDKTKNNGVLILLALEERKCRIEVGYGLEGILTDGKTGNIQDTYMIPYFKNDNWNDGIKNGFSAILQEVEKEYDVTINETEAPVGDTENSGNAEIIYLFGITEFIICFIIALVIILNRNHHGGYYSGGDFYSGGGFSSGGGSFGGGGSSEGGGSSRGF